LSLKQKVYAKLIYQKAVSSSDLIFTVSKFSKEEILKHTKCNPDKIKVVYNGVDFSRFNNRYSSEISRTVLDKYKINFPYILFVGNVKPHKNLQSALKGFREFIENSSKFSKVKFVIVGKREGFITGDLEVIYLLNQSFYSSRVQFTGWVRDEDLPDLYQNAQAFIFPSVYEGFGFPPLEAMAAGCPVISSDFACMPEIYGSAAHYFDPTDPKDIGKKIFEVLCNAELKNRLIEKGLARAQEYTWEKAISEKLVYVENYIQR
jgi:glycosyltransferase involved in cell wall biosynthesis